MQCGKWRLRGERRKNVPNIVQLIRTLFPKITGTPTANKFSAIRRTGALWKHPRESFPLGIIPRSCVHIRCIGVYIYIVEVGNYSGAFSAHDHVPQSAFYTVFIIIIAISWSGGVADFITVVEFRFQYVRRCIGGRVFRQHADNLMPALNENSYNKNARRHFAAFIPLVLTYWNLSFLCVEVAS